MRTLQTFKAWVPGHASGTREAKQKHAGERMTHRRATRYRWPSFSNSAMTQSVTQGIPVMRERGGVSARRDETSCARHFAYRQSIMPPTSSSLFCKLKLIKLVSIRTRYGGTRDVLCAKKREDGVGFLRRGERLTTELDGHHSGYVHSSNCLGLCLLCLLFLL